MSPVCCKGVQLSVHLDMVIHYLWPCETWVCWWTIGHSSSSPQILRLSRASLRTTENPAASDALREDVINSSPDWKVAEGGKEDGTLSRTGPVSASSLLLYLPPSSTPHLTPFWVSTPPSLYSLFPPQSSVNAIWMKCFRDEKREESLTLWW